MIPIRLERFTMHLNPQIMGFFSEIGICPKWSLNSKDVPQKMVKIAGWAFGSRSSHCETYHQTIR